MVLVVWKGAAQEPTTRGRVACKCFFMTDWLQVNPLLVAPPFVLRAQPSCNLCTVALASIEAVSVPCQGTYLYMYVARNHHGLRVARVIAICMRATASMYPKLWSVWMEQRPSIISGIVSGSSCPSSDEFAEESGPFCWTLTLSNHKIEGTYAPGVGHLQTLFHTAYV